jgi:hypothetical protein
MLLRAANTKSSTAIAATITCTATTTTVTAAAAVTATTATTAATYCGDCVFAAAAGPLRLALKSARRASASTNRPFASTCKL